MHETDEERIFSLERLIERMKVQWYEREDQIEKERKDFAEQVKFHLDREANFVADRDHWGDLSWERQTHINVLEDELNERDVEIKALEEKSVADDLKLAAAASALERANHEATNRAYLLRAYYVMLSPSGRIVADMWESKGVVRVHYAWTYPELQMSGEQRAQLILEWEAAMDRAKANPVNNPPKSPPPQALGDAVGLWTQFDKARNNDAS